MASDVSTSDDLRGLILHDPRIKTANLDATQSSYTQASPRPGVPEDQNTPRSSMVFETSGSQSAGGALNLRGGRGGYPGFDARGGGLLWKNNADSSTSWRGWDVPGVVTGFEFIEFNDNGVSVEVANPHAITLGDGTVLLAYTKAATGVADDKITIRSMSPGVAWSTPTSITPESQHPDLYPALLELPDGSVLLFAWQVDTGAEEAQISVWRSTDAGSTWAVVSSYALATVVGQAASGAGSTGFDLGRIRAAHQNGQIALLVSLNSRDTSVTDTEVIWQYASDDEGATFSRIDAMVADTTNGYNGEILPALGGGFLAFNFDPVSGDLDQRRLGSAFQAMTTVAATEISQPDKGAPGPIGNSAAWRDPDGTLYLVFNQPNASTAQGVVIKRSTDDGASWADLFQDSLETLFFSGDASTFLRDYTCAPFEGRVAMVTRFSSDPGTKDDASLACCYLGGSTTVTMPSYSQFRRDTQQVSFARSWVAIEQPGDVSGWTATGAGTDSLTVDGLSVVTSANAREYSRTTSLGSASTASPFGVLAELTVNSGGSTSSDAVGIRFVNADGSNSYDVRVRFSTTGLAVYDQNAGANIGTATVDMTAGVQILAAIGPAKFALWYRLTGTASDNDRAWTAGPSSSSLTSTGTGSKGLIWGHQSTATADSDWRIFNLWNLSAGDLGWESGQTNPDDLFPRPIAARFIGIDDGVKVRAIDGPVYQGETWNVNTRYDYAVENLDPALAPSPRRRWRTTGETQADIVWDLHGLAADARYGSTTLGLYLGGINWRTGSLWGRQDGGSWVKIGDLDAASGLQPLAFTRTGDAIDPNVAGSVNAAQYLQRNEYAGGSFASSTSVIRRIVRHTEGAFSNSLTRRATLFLEGVADSDPTSGDGAIWSPRLLAIAHNVGDYRYLRLRIDAQTTADGFFEIGACVLGPLALFGTPYSWGRVIDHQANVELTTARDGTRYARPLGDPRRLVSFSWAEGVDTSAVYSDTGTNAIPDYITGTTTGGAQPIGTPYDTPLTLAGVLDEINGSSTPLVYVPAIARGTPDFAQYPQRAASVYGRLMTPVRLETVQGDELGATSGEIMRVLNVEIAEEV
tara:strand:- start:579 stop:3845 length:3267 start_codon:yes stop_codon:yes gene_type:complete